MHARVNTIVGSPDQAEVGISDFKENVAPWDQAKRWKWWESCSLTEKRAKP